MLIIYGTVKEIIFMKPVDPIDIPTPKNKI